MRRDLRRRLEKLEATSVPECEMIVHLEEEFKPGGQFVIDGCYQRCGLSIYAVDTIESATEDAHDHTSNSGITDPGIGSDDAGADNNFEAFLHDAIDQVRAVCKSLSEANGGVGQHRMIFTIPS